MIATSVNDAPIFQPIIDTSMNEDDQLILALFAEDIENDPLIFGFNILENISFTFNELSDSILIQPNLNWYGSELITLTVTDEGGLSDMQFNLNIIPVNDPPQPFNLLSPEDSSIIVINNEDIYNQTELNITWETSVDIDNNDLSYGFLLFDEFSDINNQTILIDTNI